MTLQTWGLGISRSDLFSPQGKIWLFYFCRITLFVIWFIETSFFCHYHRLPIDQNTVPGYVIAFICEFISISALCITYSTTSACFMGLCVYIRECIEDLKNSFQRTHPDGKAKVSNLQVVKNVKEQIDFHNQICL